MCLLYKSFSLSLHISEEPNKSPFVFFLSVLLFFYYSVFICLFVILSLFVLLSSPILVKIGTNTLAFSVIKQSG